MHKLTSGEKEFDQDTYRLLYFFIMKCNSRFKDEKQKNKVQAGNEFIVKNIVPENLQP